MSLRGIASACLFLLTCALLSGCAADEGTTTSSTPGGDGATTTTSRPGGGGGTTTTATTTTGTGGGGGSGGSDNQAPVGAIAASIEQGQVPVNVTFELTGSDPDGDALTWHLDVDGDGITDKSGESLPATETHNYTEIGLYNVTFVITDAKGASNTYQLAINATAAAEGSGPILEATGSYLAGSPGLCAYGAGGPGGDANATDGTTYGGVPFSLNLVGKVITVEYTFTAPPGGLVVAFPNDTGAFAGQVSSIPSSSGSLSGLIPDGAVSAWVSSCGGAGVGFTLTVE